MAKLKVGVDFGAAHSQTRINLLYDNPDAQLVAVYDKYKPATRQICAQRRKQGHQAPGWHRVSAVSSRLYGRRPCSQNTLSTRPMP